MASLFPISYAVSTIPTSAAAYISSASSRDVAIGFSHSTCFPAAMASKVCSWKLGANCVVYLSNGQWTSLVIAMSSVQVLKEKSPVLVKGCDGANVNNINIWVFYEVFVTGSSFGNAMTFRKPEASNHSYFTLAKEHFGSIFFLTGMAMARQLHGIYHHGSRLARCVFLM